MGLLIFDKNEILQAVLSNDGTACPYYGAIHDEKINLENTLTFLIPADHTDAQYVTEGSLVAFKDLDSDWQLFEVKRIVDTDDTATIKQAFCDHAFYELLGDIVPSGGGAGTSAWLAVTSALSQSRWEVGNVVDLGLQTTVFSYQTALACLQQIAATWKGELQFRLDISNNIITHRYVDLVDRRGNTTGKQFVFGKDLLKIEREVDFTGVYTAMYGRGQATTEGVRLNFASINGGKEYVEDVAALAQYGIKGIKHRFGIFDDSQEADPARLLTKTQAALQIAKVPVVSYQFDAVSLEQLTPDYDHEAVRIGDVVVAIDHNFVPPLQLFVRVIQIRWNHLEFDKTKIVLGNFRQDLASNQAFQNRVNQQVKNNAGIWDNAAALVPSVLDPAIYDLTSELRSAGGYVVFSANDGIMVYDTPDPANATKAMKLGGGVFGIANSKNPDGSWNFRTFGDGAGFTADLITSGKIKADFLQIGLGSTFDPGYDPNAANTTANTANTAAGNALAAATAAQTTANTATTTANSKRRVFVAQPTAPYEVGDLWVSTNGTGDLKTCILARATGAYVAAEWMKAVKYTDDTTANAKRRVFVAQPIPPYDIGDLWVTATDGSGDLKTSTILRTTGLYTAADWVLATKYTDDATANTAIATALTAQGTANTAMANASAANTLLAEMTNDNKLTAQEKQIAKTEWDSLVSEIPLNNAQADLFGITTQKTTYDNAYAALNAYVSPLLAVLTTTSDIDGPTFRTTFKTFYDARTNLLNAISGKAKTLADTANTQATLALANAAAAQTQANKGVADALTANNLIADIASDSKMTASEKQAFKGEWDSIVAEVTANDTQAVNFGITTEKTTYDNAFSMLNTYMSPLLGDLNTTTAMDGTTFRVNINTYYIARARLLNAISLKAKTIADTAQALATSATAIIADMASDDKITPSEKQALLQDWNMIVKEEPTLESQADTYAIVAEKSSLYTAFTALGTYLNNNVVLPTGNVPYLFSDLTTTNTIVGATLRQKFVDYYGFKDMLIKAVTDAGKVLSDAAQGTANTAQANADMAQATADTAVTNAYNAKTQADLGVSNAATANGLLADIASDGKLTAQEKQNAKMEWDVIVAEKITIDAQATNYVIGVDKTNYGTAYNTLNTYITPLLTSLTTTTDINGVTFRATFKDYYDKKTLLLKAIADKAKILADNAQTQANLGVTNSTAAQAAAATAQTQANLGVADALIANNLIADIASDSKLTPSEKQAFKGEWDSIIAEVPVNDAQATTFGITTEKTNYDNAYSALFTYMSPLLTDLSVTTAMDGATFRININTYYIARAKLLLAITVKAKSLADAAQMRADLGVTNAASAQGTANTANTAAGAAQTTANTANGTANAAITNASTAQTQANLGVTNAWNAQQLLDQIGNDAYLTPVEKKTTQKEWTAIQTELPINDTLATSFAITTEKTNYDNAYSALNTYISPLLANLTTVSSIVGMTLRNTFSTYYTNRRYLLNAISTKAKATADTAVTNAAEAQTQADTALTTATSAIARTHWSDVSQNKVTTATGGTIAANGPTYYAGNWTCTVVGQKLTIDLGSLMPQIVEIGLDSWFPSDTAKIPKNFTIEWSTNNSTWTNAQTVANNAIAPYVLSTMASTFSARYIRLTVSAFQTSQTTSTIGKFWVSALQGTELTFAQNLVGAIQTATNALQISTTMYADGSGMWLVGAGGLNVVKITSGGIAVGTAGTGGAFTTAITGTGIVATAITSGTIDASKMTVINLNAGSITTGTMVADRISGGTLTGVIVNATSSLSVSSNVWNAGSSNGLTFGGVLTNFDPPVTMKYLQGYTGDGISVLTLLAGGNCRIQLQSALEITLYGPVWCNNTVDITGTLDSGSHNITGTLQVSQQSWFTGKIYANGGLQIPSPVWTTPSLGGGWSQFVGQEIFAYYKDPFGFVHFKGSIKGGLNSTDIFILPSGSRPSGATHFAVIGDNGGDVFASVYIGPSGNVRSGSGTSTIRSFDGITFLGN